MKGNMQVRKRNFAQTGKDISLLGLGTVKFGRNQGVKYPEGEGFKLPSDQEIINILNICIEHGINLLDTAPAYGTAEERLGKALKAFNRDDFFIATKTGEEFENGESQHIFTKKHTQMSIERSLRRLGTDRLDSVLVHCNHNDKEIIENTPVLETLSRLKEKGDILSYGASTYSIETGKKVVDLCDTVMVAYNPDYTDELSVIEYAKEQNKAVLIKKGLASGHIGKLSPQETIQHIVSTPGVTSMIFGSLTPQHILDNIKAIR